MLKAKAAVFAAAASTALASIILSAPPAKADDAPGAVEPVIVTQTVTIPHSIRIVAVTGWFSDVVRVSRPGRDGVRTSTWTNGTLSDTSVTVEPVVEVVKVGTVGRTAVVQPIGTHGTTTGKWGARIHPITGRHNFHSGVDIGDQCNAKVYAAADGKVTQAGRAGGGSGTMVKIAHGTLKGSRHVSTAYLHLRKEVVHKGQRVQQGQVIGYSGKTGAATGCHLHFSTFAGKKNVNPTRFLGRLSHLHRRVFYKLP